MVERVILNAIYVDTNHRDLRSIYEYVVYVRCLDILFIVVDKPSDAIVLITCLMLCAVINTFKCRIKIVVN